MFRYCLIAILLLVGANCFAQRNDTLRVFLDDQLQFSNKKKGLYPAMAVKSNNHWFLVSVYPDTGLLVRAYFADRDLSVKDGPFQLYHRNNVKAMEGIYSNNTRQGVWKYWYPNGQIKDSGVIKNNQLVNTWFSWYENGQLMAIAQYLHPDSIPDDIVIRSDNRFGKKGLFNEDTTVTYLHGPYLSFYASGNRKDSGNYVNGLREGEWKSWYEDGNPESRGIYIKGEQSGTWEYFNENGNISTRETYLNNKITNLECFDTSGNSQGYFCSIQKPAVPVTGSYTNFQNYMLDNIFWPRELDGKNINGVVRVSYTISREGMLYDIKVLATPHQLLAQEVVRFLQGIPRWQPAVSHNRVVEYRGLLEVPFYR